MQLAMADQPAYHHILINPSAVQYSSAAIRYGEVGKNSLETSMA